MLLAAPEQSDSFNYVDPTSDHHKWKRKGLSLYYACVVDNDTSTTDGSGGVICALRAATESTNTNNNKAPIFLIDYVYSHPSHREKGIAGKLITKVLSMAKSNGATLGVLSLEQSCVYWLEKHNFLLCQNSILNERLNVFPDTHLLIHKDCKIDSTITNGNNGSSEIVDTNNNNTATDEKMIPPQTFVSSLKQLQIIGTTNPSLLSECLITLSKIIHNAKYDQSENYRRRTIKINNPIIHSKVMAFGGEVAMNLLQCCGFELSVNEDGDAILKFVDAYEYKWLDGAVAQLEYEGSR